MKDNQLNQNGSIEASTVNQSVMHNKKAYINLRIHGVLWSILFITSLLCLCWIYAGASEGSSAPTIIEGDEWQYFKGVDGPPFKWSYLGYDDSGWLKGRSGLGYGAGTFGTFLNDMKGTYQKVYVRREFWISAIE